MDSAVEPVMSYRFRRTGSDRTAYANAISWNLIFASSCRFSGALSVEEELALALFEKRTYRTWVVLQSGLPVGSFHLVCSRVLGDAQD